nr:retrovirus-related Pol polyprotein from transposon 17.6 [Tanacetum cinerariifolium]
MVRESVEIFMDDFSIFGQSFEIYLGQLKSVLKRCIETNLVLSWEKSHFIVREGIVLWHVVPEKGFKVDRPRIKKGSKNVVADHLSRINPPPFNPSDVINESFLDESLFKVSKLPWAIPYLP